MTTQLHPEAQTFEPDSLDANQLLKTMMALKRGDFSVRLPIEWTGTAGKIADTFNYVVEMNERMAGELERLRQAVAKEGKINQRALPGEFGGSWLRMIESVNTLIDELVRPTSEMSRVIGAVAKGDLSQAAELEVSGRPLEGEFLKTAKTINTMVDQLRSFASEVTRVAREVGTEGKLGGQAIVPGVAGTWKDLTDNVNLMASNLTGQVRNIAEVTIAVANGDLSKKITADVRGEILQLKETINTMVDQLRSFASEVTRVAREVGTEGKLGGQAIVPGVAGTWKDLTDNVNSMASNLTGQVRNIAEVTIAVASGDLSKKITADVRGEILQLKETINTMVDQLRSFASEVTRVAREVGTEGKLGGQAQVPGVAGTWKDLTDNVNSMASNLTGQVRNIAEVTTAVANGDLSKKITADVRGEILQLKETINTMVDQLRSFASEVTRVAREVGTEGKLAGQAVVPGVAGTWKDLTDNVNLMASNLTGQVRNIAEVTIAVANGDLSKKITVDVKGEILALKNTINIMVDQLNAFAGEVTRVAREVGTEGNLGGQAVVPGVAGTWKDLTDNVNLMASNLTGQVRNIAEVTIAVANGDLSKKITVDVKGEILALKNTINIMVDQLNAFAGEVTRVAREVGTEGNLGGQAQVPGVAGTWKDLTENVNLMASNLTGQVRNIAEVTIAVARGDLSKKITADVRGEILQLKETINTMVDQLGSFASEVTRVAREVGTEGKLGGQAYVQGVGGTWKELTDNVNFMASNLTGQVRNIADVTTAVAKGDLSKKITVDVKGEILELKNTINTMVDQLNAFAGEVTRVAREVGTEGKLGGQAEVPGVGGTWKDLTDSVNSMANNLTDQVRNIADVTISVANGDLSKKITVDVRGEILRLKETINTMVDQLRSFASEVTRVAREVGTEGKLGGQAYVQGVGGTWKDLTDNVNSMASNLTGQVRNIADVTTAVARGDLSKKITVDVKGEILELKNTINTMVDQLNAFGGEVTRVAREVGTEGKLGGQAQVKGVSGVWKDLTDNVNLMAANLTDQVRNIAKVVSSVASGELKQKLTVVAKGEIATLADTINSMIDTLATFAAQVTSVAREVGVEGRLGGQANVPGAAGTWKDLTDNVNQLAANLTTQVRAIAEVATAVTKGDLTRSIRVDASGEVETLKDTINQMIANLRGTTQKNAEQDWLKTNLARFTRMLQGQRELPTVAKAILSELNQVVAAQHSAFYIADSKEQGETRLRLLSGFAYRSQPDHPKEFALGEGLVGECAQEKTRLLLNKVPGNYIRISSAVGEASPLNIVVLPVLFEGQIKGVLELASFETFNTTHLAFLEQLMESIGIVINTLEATLRTETLLKHLQSQQEELQKTNQELEEKADQLALTSKYKSEFLSNMSHELRTPLNSMLILSQQLAEDSKSLTPKQVEFARAIHASGGDLLLLINDILDLAKVESGTMTLDVDNVPFNEMREHMERLFRHVAEGKSLNFNIEVDSKLGEEIHTDSKRLEQVLRNLLSNAFKFTEKGQVSLKISSAKSGWSPDHPILSKAEEVVAFSVIDTGIGIPEDKQKIIFEAFQQAESGTSRKYGGTGLGLSISRELAKLLGGQLTLSKSRPGSGSTFVLFMPKNYIQVKSPTVVASPAENSALMNPKSFRDPSKKESEGLLVTASKVADDRKNIKPGDKVLLIVENDANFARILVDIARDNGFKSLVALRGDTALRLADEFKPSAVTLDIQLPDIDGWKILSRFKNDLAARHIPVEIISADEDWTRGLKQGAVGFLAKPVSKEGLKKAFEDIQKYLKPRLRQVLLVCAEKSKRNKLKEMLESEEVKVGLISHSKEALPLLKKGNLDCLVMELPDPNGFRMLKDIHSNPDFANLPTIVYINGNLTKEEETQLRRATKVCVLKEVKSVERVVDEVALFLHQATAKLPETKRKDIEQLHQSNAALTGRKVMVVDDDYRNIFAMTSLLDHQKMNVISAESGREAIELLEKTPDVDIVLMDIMMPEMDGFDTMQAIRQREAFKSLPIVALTAKAMKGDREKCIESGASDYITKPVDSEQLLAIMRVWLSR
jgi:HAMP domain-containing protein/signal transduction histidine kinase/CheY-like chemotaxis protein